MFTIELEPDEVSVLGKALRELPFREAAPLIKRIDEQLMKQLQAQQRTALAPQANPETQAPMLAQRPPPPFQPDQEIIQQGQKSARQKAVERQPMRAAE
jgi:hypothetical protein